MNDQKTQTTSNKELPEGYGAFVKPLMHHQFMKRQKNLSKALTRQLRKFKGYEKHKIVLMWSIK